MRNKRYKNGLVIGKFMPPHKGHFELVSFALKYCDKLLVAVCSRPQEPINGELRYQWMKDIFKNNKKIIIVHIKKDLPQDRESSRYASKIWAEYLKKRFGEVEAIFSSEEYGAYLAEYMKIEHKIFDLKREKIPISAREIRHNPFRNWKYILKEARPYFVKKICIYGSESTGKSTLTKLLARHYKTVFVPECARDYIAKQNNKFSYKDMAIVAKVQVKLEQELIKKANKILFCDTDSITTLIYSRHYFGKIPKIVKELADGKRYDLYLFTKADLPWVADPQRDLGKRRKEFERIFMKELTIRKLPFIIIYGREGRRLKFALDAVNGFIRVSNKKE